MSAPKSGPPIEFLHPPTEGLVSCVIPVYDGERFVAEAIESVLAQSHDRHEIIVVDDGSRDGTGEVLKSFGDRITVFRQENAGPSAARNVGMSRVHGEWIAFLDADDLWVPEKTEVQLGLFEAHPELELVSGHMKSFWIPELQHEAERLAEHPYHASRHVLSPCTVLFRRSLVERIGGFDEALRFGEDTDWFMRMMKSGVPYDVLDHLVLHRRQHTTNLTRQEIPGPERVVELLKRNLDRARGASS